MKHEPSDGEAEMNRNKVIAFMSGWFLALAFSLSGPSLVFAHCDGLDGPVVKAAQQALEKGNVNLVLAWVPKRDEPALVDAFHKTLAVRSLSREAKELADRYFFETLVRVHRAGEGEPYTGLKPAGRDLGPAIPAADKALENGDVEPLVRLLTEAARAGVRERFAQAVARKTFNAEDVDAGREFIELYVPFIHYVERLYDAAKTSAGGHFPESHAGEHHRE
jgi:hypothetical protein